MDKGLFDKINQGVNIASQMVTRGAGEISKQLKPTKETAKITLQTAMFYKRLETVSYGRFVPIVDIFEPQLNNKMVLNLIKNITLPAGERLFVQGSQALLLGREKEAIDRFLEAVAKDPQMTDGYYMLGCLYLSRGDYRLSLENYKKAILLQQTLNKVIKRYIPSFKMTLNVTRNSCIAFFADLIGINSLLAITMRAEGMRQEAIEVLDQMLGVMPSQGVLHFFMAAMLYEAGSNDRVVEYLKNSQPDSNLGYLNLLILGRVLISMGDVETAKEVFKKSITREDMDPELLLDYHYSLGLCDMAGGWNTGRSEEIERVMVMKPDYQDVFDRLGLRFDSGFRERTAPPSMQSQAPAAPPPVQPQAPAVQSPAAQTQAPPVTAAAQQPVKPSRPSSDTVSSKGASQPQKSAAIPPVSPSAVPRLMSEDQKINVVLENASYVIGRETGDIVMDWDVSASKQHARITRENSIYYIEDIGSTNGTWVNQYRIVKKVNLNRGDVVMVGKTSMRFL